MGHLITLMSGFLLISEDNKENYEFEFLLKLSELVVFGTSEC